jgi:hypothetical protein
MESCDGPRDGVVLPPVFSSEMNVSRLVHEAISSHENGCLFNLLEIEKRIRTMENRFFLMCGFMLGSGVIGGATGAGLIKLLAG